MKPKTFPRRASCRHPQPARVLPLMQAACLISAGLMPDASAETVTWSGDTKNPEVLWSDIANWNAVPITGDDLVFTGSAGLASTNDLPTNAEFDSPSPPNTLIAPAVAVNSITFDAAAGESFELSGNDILFNGRTILNNSPFRQSLYLRLQETAAGIIAGGTGDLYLAGLETNSFSHVFVKNDTGFVEVDGTYDLASGSPSAPFQLTVNGGTLDWSGGVFGTVNVNTDATLFSSSATWHYNTTLKLNSATSTVGFAMNTGVGELDAVAGSTIKNLGTGGVTIIDFNQDPVTRINDIAGNLIDGDAGGRLGLLLGINTGIPLVNLSGQNTYTGDTELRTAGSKLNLLAGGKLTFRIEPDGVCNRIFGPGQVTLNGAFAFDLAAAGTPAVGSKWVIVQAGIATYGATFAVNGFTETAAGSGIWKFNDGSHDWYFTKASGKLSYGVLPDSIWSGGGGGGSWSTGANWTSLSAPVTGDLPTFTGAQTPSVNDTATAWDPVNAAPGPVQLAGLRFDALAASFNLTGNELYLNQKTIQNLSPNPQTISAGIAAITNGFTVNTSAGDIILAGSLNNYDPTSPSNRALVKTGSGRLVLNGTQNRGWALNVNAGTLQVFNPVANGIQAGAGGTISSGAVLRTETPDAYSPNASVTVHGTLDVAEGGEQMGAVTGTGVVTNHGPGGGTTLLSFQRNNTSWGGVIQDGGNVTAVAFTGTTNADTVTFGGHNRYTGDTTIGANATFTLANGASLLFRPRAAGVSNQITGTGTAILNGRLKLDLSAAAAGDGNAWPLVDVAGLTETFGATFAVTDSAWIPSAATRVNASANAIGDFVSGTSYVSGGGIYNGGSGPINLTGVTDPAPEAVYIAERYGNMTYTFGGLEIGNAYKVRLHFAEVYHNAANRRKFDVAINGTLQLDDYDIWVAAGNAQKKAVIEERTVTANASGAVVIAFTNVVDNAKICGIEIIDTRPGSPTPDFTKAGSLWTRTDGGRTWTFSESTGVLTLATSGGASGFSAWIAASGLAPADQDPAADPDRDGLDNLIEYALAGLDPARPDAMPGTLAAGVLSYAKRPEAVSAGDVGYAFESSTDLGLSDDWSPLAATVDTPTTLACPLAAAGGRNFVRLKVSR